MRIHSVIAITALSLLGMTRSAEAQSVQSYVVTIDASTVQPIGTGFVPANANGDVIVLAQGNVVSGADPSRFDEGWQDASGRTRLDRAGQPITNGMPYGALVGGFSATLANYRFVGEMGSFHLLNAHVGHQFELGLNMSNTDLAAMEGSITATVIYIPAGSADIAKILIDASSPATIPTGLIAGSSEQFIVMPYGALCPTTGSPSLYTGSCFGPEGLISYNPAGKPRPEGPYGALLGQYNGGGPFHIGDGGTWSSQPADLGQELSLLVNLPFADLANLDGSFTVNVIRVPVSTTAVENPIEVGEHHLTSGPNPARDVSTLRFELPQAETVLLRVADVSGRWVRTLAQSPMTAGAQSVRWDGRDDAGREVPNGTYFCQLATADGSSTARVVLAR